MKITLMQSLIANISRFISFYNSYLRFIKKKFNLLVHFYVLVLTNNQRNPKFVFFRMK